MSHADAFTGSLPEIYDRYLVPLLFAPYAADLGARVARLEPHAVLETAAGTGALTRELAARLPPRARIVATDLNEPMLARLASNLPGERITVQPADGQDLPFDDALFDVVVCQFGVMFFPDKVKAYREARRVLKGGGHFIFAAWDRLSENELADAVHEALGELLPAGPPQFLLRTPHGYYDAAEIREQVSTAGFMTIDIDTVDHRSRSASAGDIAVAFCQGTPLKALIVSQEADLSQTTQATAERLARRFGDGPIDVRMRALVITATEDRT